MSERYVPIDPFLLESKCWSDCIDIMKDILDFNTRTIDLVLKKLTEGLEILDNKVIELIISLAIIYDSLINKSTSQSSFFEKYNAFN